MNTSFLKTALVLLVLILACRQTYWVLHHGGNLHLRTYNLSDIDSVSIEVYLDGKPIETQALFKTGLPNSEVVSILKTTGIYELQVVVPEHGISKSVPLDLLTAQWVSIKFIKMEQNTNLYDLQLNIKSSPWRSNPSKFQTAGTTSSTPTFFHLPKQPIEL